MSNSRITLNDVLNNLRKFFHDYHETQLKGKLVATQNKEEGFTPPLFSSPSLKTIGVASEEIQKAIENRAWVSAKPTQAQVAQRAEEVKFSGRFGLFNIGYRDWETTQVS